MHTGHQRRGLQHRRRQRGEEHRPHAHGPEARRARARELIKPVPIARATIAATASAPRSCARWAGRRRSTSSRASRRPSPGTRRTSGGGGRSRSATRLQGLHRSAVRQALMAMATVLVTGAAGFVGSHLLELLERGPTPTSSPGCGRAPSRSSAASRVTLGRGRDARSRRGGRGDRRDQAVGGLSPRRRAARRRFVARTPTKPSQATCSPRITSSTALRAAQLQPRVLITSSASVYAPHRSRDHRRRSRPPEQPVRHQQARAGDARAARVGRRRHSGVDRARVQSHRAAAGAVVRRVEHRAADRARSKRAAGRRC